MEKIPKESGGENVETHRAHSVPALGTEHCQDTAEQGERWRIQGRLSLAVLVDSVSRTTMVRLMGRRWSILNRHRHRPPVYSPVPTRVDQFDKPALPLLPNPALG